MAIKILMADDHFVVRQGVRQMIGLFPDFEVVGEASSGEELLDKIRATPADLVLTDMTMPGLCGADLITRVRAEHASLPILVLSMHNDVQIAFRALGNLGLFAMQVRAKQVGGSITIQSAPGDGTVVRANFPLNGSPPDSKSSLSG